MITICCICHRVKLPTGEYCEPSEDDETRIERGEPVSHGLCPICYESESKKFEKEEK